MWERLTGFCLEQVNSVAGHKPAARLGCVWSDRLHIFLRSGHIPHERRLLLALQDVRLWGVHGKESVPTHPSNSPLLVFTILGLWAEGFLGRRKRFNHLMTVWWTTLHKNWCKTGQWTGSSQLNKQSGLSTNTQKPVWLWKLMFSSFNTFLQYMALFTVLSDTMCKLHGSLVVKHIFAQKC